MKQVLLDGQGQVQVVDVPAPALQSGHVLVHTAYSLISSGTELAAMRHRATSPLRRALARPELIRSLGQQVLSEGLGATRERVADRLSSWTPVGYSLAGTVTETGQGVEGLKPGDRVACSGSEYAQHAEVVAVPARLALPVPAGVDLRAAAFAPVGAIALQAVRRSGATLGETVVVIGLGLVGLLICQLLRASGCHVLGIDPSAKRRKLAERLGCAVAHPDDSDLGALTVRLTGGLGADAVIIAAGTSSDTPVNQAFSLARERGRVVVVGDVGMKLDREEFYRKELDLLMSRSLGPGRYDPRYEQQGVDYPPAYVRWTEARNIEAYLGLMADKRLDPDPLVSAEFYVDQAPAAYSHLSQNEDAAATLLRYAEDRAADRPTAAPTARRVAVSPDDALTGRLGVGLIGAGDFARAVHLPLLKRSADFGLRGVCGRRGPNAQHVARQFGAAYAATDVEDILNDPLVQVVWITTPHDTHAGLAVRALEAGKHVFVEKPLGLTLEECKRVRDAVRSSDRLLTVGFNRRFAPASEVAREHFADASQPKEVLYRVRAGAVPEGNWLDDPAIGGGRVFGECVHFFDWMAWFLNEEPQQIRTVRAPGKDEGVAVVIQFGGGSVGTLVYTGGGASAMPKERVEVLGVELTAVIDDFRTVELFRGSRRLRRRRAAGKGFTEQMQAFAGALKGQSQLKVSVEDGVRATACAVAALAAVRLDIPQRVELE